jgi:hypothetical protein
MAATTSAVLSVAALATATYLNAKLGIENDVRQLCYDREWLIQFQQWLKTLGRGCTLYHILELADSEAEALWFEGRAWTYAQLKDGEYSNSQYCRRKELIILCRS